MDLPTSDAGTKVCPQCAEEVKAAARICRFCGYEFDPLASGSGPVRTALSPNSVAPAAATAIARQRSKTPLVVLLLAVLVVAVGAFLVMKQSSVSDAASIWCAGNGDAVVAAGRQLGVYPPDALPVRISNAVFTVGGLRSTGVSIDDIEKVLSGDSSLITDWQTADSGSFARACGAAFDAR